MKVSTDAPVLASLHRAVNVVRAETSCAQTPNPAVASFLFERARATYDLLAPDVQRVCHLRNVVRVA